MKPLRSIHPGISTLPNGIGISPTKGGTSMVSLISERAA